MNADDYLGEVRALVLADPLVTHWLIVREESEGDAGLYRYRLTLIDGSLLEAFEWFEIVEAVSARTLKYSFHWQAADGTLISRWDNAPHHPEIATAPDHVHSGGENIVQPSSALSLRDVLAFIERQARQGRTA